MDDGCGGDRRPENPALDDRKLKPWHRATQLFREGHIAHAHPCMQRVCFRDFKRLYRSRGEDSMSTQWTDEKHSLYLNSMEASFVEQLYISKYHLEDLLGWPSRTRKATNSQHVNSAPSGQFKVLRGGCWEKLNFGRAANDCINIENEARILSANPWIQHFKSSSVGKEQQIAAFNQMDSSDSATQHIYFADQIGGRGATSLLQFDCSAPGYHQDSIGSCTEVSDQNFVDQDIGRRKRRNTCRQKKAKTAIDDMLFNDQVVPLGKLHGPIDVEDRTPFKGKDAGCSGSRK